MPNDVLFMGPIEVSSILFRADLLCRPVSLKSSRIFDYSVNSYKYSCLSADTTSTVAVAVTVSQDSSSITFSNSLLSFDLLKSNGYIRDLVYQNTSLLGTATSTSGNLYTDFPGKAFALVGNPTYQIVSGRNWAGVILTDNDTSTSSVVQRYWFLRDGETGLHSFLRLAYFNDTPLPDTLSEVRTMFRPNPAQSLWTYLVTNEEQWAPAPSAEALASEVQVQDATWYLGLTPQDQYVLQESDYWTKYTFADNQTNKAHGLVANIPDGTTLGAWWVGNQRDTGYGGPAHLDLMVDGIIYNKLSSSHGGAISPNVTNGFDRTFGPQFLYFNHGHSASLQSLLKDAEQYADPSWNAAFYDEISTYVPGYYATKRRGEFRAQLSVPRGASDVTAVLAANGVDFQASAEVPSAFQYWQTNIKNGEIDLKRVREGRIFGEFIEDDIVVKAGRVTSIRGTWKQDTAGRELWRIGTPDKTSGEFRNGWERDDTHPRAPHKYRIFWGAWDFPTQFPNGVNFTVGKSKEATDFNYIHWARYGPTYTRNDTVTNINNWQINFDLSQTPPKHSSATLTILLAAAYTTAGNTHLSQGAYPSFDFLTYVNDNSSGLSWTIGPDQSSSCGVRSAISCTTLSKKFTFPGTWLRKGHNKLVLSLPFNSPIYVQYDAIRLELE
ncbi:hypothetical protein EIP91_002845 [Steccherinum ochraceum]|uniref:Rhamnogalacturonan lyase domain-containing protein n=1 Tax=Steccherinum ochraceum TaxID=92696 RepID=A0A4R0REX8_9APHY|nr:hypothetical protein EIP91_002845 [Steccherinum ochraceum]